MADLFLINLADCYRLLGLRSGASQAEIKTSYRTLARQYHPDFNPGDKQAQDKFVALTKAYKYILSNLNEAEESDSIFIESDVSGTQKPKVTVTRKSKPIEKLTPLSPIDFNLKWNSYHQLQELLKMRRFARAITLVEALSQRLPDDSEVRQWQAIAYQSWGRQLISEKQLDKARIYLKKALKIDPHNRALWAEVERDFRKIEQIFK